MSTRINIHVDVKDRLVAGEYISALARLWLETSSAIFVPTTSDGAAYLRRLATEADKLADAIDARLAESTAGETRDVPTPGAAR